MYGVLLILVLIVFVPLFLILNIINRKLLTHIKLTKDILKDTGWNNTYDPSEGIDKLQELYKDV